MERDRDHRREPAPWGQHSHEQSRGEPGAVRGGKEGETERKVSQPGWAFLSPQPHTDFPAESPPGDHRPPLQQWGRGSDLNPQPNHCPTVA